MESWLTNTVNAYFWSGQALLILARNYANCIVRRQITGEVSDDGMKITKSMVVG